MREKQRTYTKNEKQKQVILYAIQRAPSINRTKLMKYVFLIDLFAFNKFHETLLEDNYSCLHFGPVPDYGMVYTNTSLHQEEYQVIQKQFKDGNGYYFEYYLKDEVVPSIDMTKIFKPVERDLIDLTLRTVKYRTAECLSSYTHTLDLWKDHRYNERISLDEFKLPPAKMEELEQLLSTKIYANSVNPKGPIWFRKMRSKYQNKNNDTKPNRLPVFIDAKTGDIIGEGVNNS